MTPAELAPHARASVRATRRTFLVLGALLLTLGLFVVGLLAAVTLSGGTRPEDGVLPIAIVALVVAVLPGGLLTRIGLRRDDAHPLVVALERDPDRLRAVGFGYREGLRGYTRIANVTLTDGRAYAFDVT